jgi:hypothetical protein
VRALGDSGLAMLLVFSAVFSWSGANICWVMAGKSKSEKSDWIKTLSLVGVIFHVLILPGLISGPGVFEAFLALLIATPILWGSSYALARRHKAFWEIKFQAVRSKLPIRKNKKN